MPADVLLGYYREAQQRFGVSWEILAAVNFVESRFGRVVSPSWAAARGPMQFIRPTWAAYGLGGDVRTYQPSLEYTQFIPVRNKRSENPHVFGFRIIAGTVGSFATTEKVKNANSLALLVFAAHRS